MGDVMAEKEDLDVERVHRNKGRWVTPEELATLIPVGLTYIRHLYSKSCEKWRCASRFDERDLMRFSKSKVLIWYMPRNPATGEYYPRTVERQEDVVKRRLVRF